MSKRIVETGDLWYRGDGNTWAEYRFVVSTEGIVLATSVNNGRVTSYIKHDSTWTCDHNFGFDPTKVGWNRISVNALERSG
jgi:hypothetical protein